MPVSVAEGVKFHDSQPPVGEEQLPKRKKKNSAGLTKTTEGKLPGQLDYCESSCHVHINLVKSFKKHLQNQFESAGLPSVLQWRGILHYWATGKKMHWCGFLRTLATCHLEKEKKVAASNLLPVEPSALQIHFLSSLLSKVPWFNSSCYHPNLISK